MTARETPGLSYGLETWRAVVFGQQAENKQENNARTCAPASRQRPRPASSTRAAPPDERPAPHRPPGPRLVWRRLHRLRRGDGGAGLRRPPHRALPRPADPGRRSPASPASAPSGSPATPAPARRPGCARSFRRSTPACARLGAPILHYKLCSTLDSAPEVGSIGTAAELGLGRRRDRAARRRRARGSAAGRRSARSSPAPATAQSTASTATRRCRVHPVTPMHEADVRRHLARQTALPIGLVDLVDLKSGQGPARLAEAQRTGGLVAVDVVDDDDPRRRRRPAVAGPGLRPRLAGRRIRPRRRLDARRPLGPGPAARAAPPGRPHRRRLGLLLAGHRRPDRRRRGRRLRDRRRSTRAPRTGTPPPTPPWPPSAPAARRSSPPPAAATTPAPTPASAPASAACSTA